jgi:uncharacterized protein GlcG (DUF336 family)
MKLEHALAIVQTVIAEAGRPVAVFVADAHGELVAAATMDGARDLAVKVADDAVERASFDPFFTFFQGGVAAFDGTLRVGSVGVSGLAGPDDDSLARRALALAGLGDGTG